MNLAESGVERHLSASVSELVLSEVFSELRQLRLAVAYLETHNSI